MRSRPAPALATLAAATLAAAMLAACSAPESHAADGAADRSSSQSPGATQRFQLGVIADSSLIARWDHDVRPDGHGLPAGRGSVAQGRIIFARACAMCHGPSGREGPFTVLVGGDPWGRDGPPKLQTVGNWWPYATTLYDYIGRAMPQNAPGSLTPDETYAVIAWLLAQNQIVPDDAVLDSASLVAIRMPARDRFVPDDRKGGPEVR